MAIPLGSLAKGRHATTLSRAAAVDGKTSKQAREGDRTGGAQGTPGGAGKLRGAVACRRLWFDSAKAGYAREALKFPGLRVLLRADRETRLRGHEPTTETRCFASSLAPAQVGPHRLLNLVRGRWQVENSLHSENDRWWDEDRHLCRGPGPADGFTTLLTAALTALRAMGREPRGRIDERSGRRAQWARQPRNQPEQRPDFMN